MVTDGRTDGQTKYNPRCACAPRVNYSWGNIATDLQFVVNGDINGTASHSPQCFERLFVC